MKIFLLFELLLIYLSICWSVWAQQTETNAEPTTQLSGNTEPLTSTTTTTRQTPKTGDNQTDYETTTAIEGNDLVSMNTTSDTQAMSGTELRVRSNETSNEETNNSENTTNSITTSDDFLNSTSDSIQTNNSEERQTSDTLITTQTPIPNTSELYLTNSSSIENTSEAIQKSAKSLNLSETDDSMQSQTSSELSSSSETTTVLPLRSIEGLSPTANQSSDSMSSAQNSTFIETSSQTSAQSSGIGLREGVRNRFEGILSNLSTIQSNESMASEERQQTGVNTKIESNQRTTESAVNYAENDTNSERQNISSTEGSIDTLGPHQSTRDHDQSDPSSHPSLHNQSLSNFSDPQNITAIYANASDIGNTIAPEGIQSSETTTQSVVTLQPQNSTQKNLSEANDTNIQMITNSSSTASHYIIGFSTQSTQMSSETTQTTTPSTQPSGSSAQTSIEPTVNKNETQSQPEITREPKQTHSSESPQTSTSSEPIQTTLKPISFESHSPESVIRTTESSHLEHRTTESRPESSVPTVTKPNTGVTNESESPIDSQTTNKQPLTDHSLKTTDLTRPLTTTTPNESNLNLVRVVLPNIKYITSPNISKNDLVNLVTITFDTNSLEIFRWVSTYDPLFRNYTCALIDTERKWCTIDRFVYLSPSPLIRDNHLILNFFIDDSNENGLTNYHFFSGHQIVESLKNSTNSLESMMLMKVSSLQTNLGTVVVKPLLESSPERLAKFELLVFVFTVVMFVCTVLLCLAIICSCAKRKSVDMNQIQLSNAGRRHTSSNGGYDLNPASHILRDENEDKINHNVINLEGWVAPMDQIDNEKNHKYDNLQDTKL